MTNTLTPAEQEIANGMLNSQPTQTSSKPNAKVAIVEDNNDYTVYRLADGTFKREMKFQKFWSRTPNTEDETMELYKLFNESDDAENVHQFKKSVGEIITIKNFFVNPYASFDEETGEVTQGMTLMLEDDKGEFYVTSSKSAYYTLKNIFNTFKLPNTDGYKPIKVVVTETRNTQTKNMMIGLKLVGFA